MFFISLYFSAFHHCWSSNGAASQYKDIQTFRRFIDLIDTYNGDLSSRDSEKATPLHYAAQSTTDNDKQKDEMIEYLVAKKVEVDSRDIYDRTPLIWAATTGHYNFYFIFYFY